MFSVTDSPFYRVTAKALIFDDQKQLLVVRNEKNEWELPGGGWEHVEDFEEGLKREIAEELGVSVRSVGPIQMTYRGVSRRHGYITLRLVAPVELDSFDFVCGDGMQEARFVGREEFMAIDLLSSEGAVQELVDQIWPAS